MAAMLGVDSSENVGAFAAAAQLVAAPPSLETPPAAVLQRLLAEERPLTDRLYTCLELLDSEDSYLNLMGVLRDVYMKGKTPVHLVVFCYLFHSPRSNYIVHILIISPFVFILSNLLLQILLQ
jgi:hypothetical protein